LKSLLFSYKSAEQNFHRISDSVALIKRFAVFTAIKASSNSSQKPQQTLYDNQISRSSGFSEDR
jgi:hypothetical protein